MERRFEHDDVAGAEGVAVQVNNTHNLVVVRRTASCWRNSSHSRLSARGSLSSLPALGPYGALRTFRQARCGKHSSATNCGAIPKRPQLRIVSPSGHGTPLSRRVTTSPCLRDHPGLADVRRRCLSDKPSPVGRRSCGRSICTVGRRPWPGNDVDSSACESKRRNEEPPSRRGGSFGLASLSYLRSGTARVPRQAHVRGWRARCRWRQPRRGPL